MNKSSFSSFTISIAMLVAIIIVGETGYILIEGYSFIDAFFMTMITVSTVGFSEVHPLTQAGQLFTVFLIVFSFGAFAYAVTSITRFMVDGGFHNYFINKRTARKISKLSEHVILIGFGRNGTEAARQMKLKKIPFVVIESDQEIMQQIRQVDHYLYVEGDSTDEEVLKQAGIQRARALITTMPNDAANLLVVISAHAINPDLQIISRASHEWNDMKLKRAGASNISMPDMVGGRRMAKLVASPNVMEFLEYMRRNAQNNVKLVELSCTNLACGFIDRTIGELKFKKISGVNIVGLKDEKGKYIFNPSPGLTLSVNYKLFVMGTDEQLAKLKAAVFH